MGAWGLGLFESDHDLDCVSYISQDAGFEDEESVYCPEDPDKARQKLNTALPTLTSQYISRVGKKPINGDEAWFRPEYKLILLTACAMSLGCTLPAELCEFVEKNYRTVGIQRDGITQMDKALSEYKNGTPYKLIELDPEEEDFLFPGSGILNTTSPEWGPGHKDFMQTLAAEFSKKKEAGEFAFPASACGNCGGAEAVRGGRLLRCARCKTKLYCSDECQAAHWKKHKKICKAPEQ